MTTERVLPAIALPVPQQRPAAPSLPRTRVDAPARKAVRRKEAILTTPARAGILIGASAAIYAVSLAGVAGLQAQDDAATAERRQPYLDVIAQARIANDRLEAAIPRANAQVRAVGSTYTQTGAALTAYQGRLDALAAMVAEIQGSAAALPTRISLPSVTVRSAGSSSRRSAAPKTTSTTGASGG